MDDMISRQAARDALNQLSIDNFSLGDWFQTYLTALIAADDTIKSLPSVQPESTIGQLRTDNQSTKMDVISRQVAIDRINTQRAHLQPDIYPQDEIGDAAYRICAEFIERLPSVQPQRMRGRWIEVNDAYNRISGRCSNCGWEAHLYEDDVVGMPYCPNCGAKMEVEHETD